MKVLLIGMIKQPDVRNTGRIETIKVRLQATLILVDRAQSLGSLRVQPWLCLVGVASGLPASSVEGPSFGQHPRTTLPFSTIPQTDLTTTTEPPIPTLWQCENLLLSQLTFWSSVSFHDTRHRAPATSSRLLAHDTKPPTSTVPVSSIPAHLSSLA